MLTFTLKIVTFYGRLRINYIKSKPILPIYEKTYCNFNKHTDIHFAHQFNLWSNVANQLYERRRNLPGLCLQQSGIRTGYVGFTND